MKRILRILSLFLLLFAFCACSHESINENSSKNATHTQKSTMHYTEAIEKSDDAITIKIGDKVFRARLYDNETAKAFSDMLPLTVKMNELHHNEKYYNLSHSLPTESSYTGAIKSGDIMLYGSDCLVLFYDSFSTSYSYTQIGRIEHSEELSDAVGSGDITITFDK